MKFPTLMLFSALVILSPMRGYGQNDSSLAVHTQNPDATACSQSVLSDASLSVQQRNKGVLLRFLDRTSADQFVDVDLQTIDPSYHDADIMRVVLQSTAAISEVCPVSIRFQRSESTRLTLSAANASSVGDFYRKGSATKALDVFAESVIRPDGGHIHLPVSPMDRMKASFALGAEFLEASNSIPLVADAEVADSPEPCPLVFTAEYSYSEITLDVRNVTTKPITGARYQVQYEDAVGVNHDAIYNYISSWTMKPGVKPRSQSWDMEITHRGDKYLIWLNRVKFADGSIWVRSDKSCQTNSVEEPKKDYWGRTKK